ncbi:MAG: aldo/keto reductase [Defluviitaleaceae bacterium]|nr:aldo/keto reductase [Defluviitaleaceae bacterium]
MNVKLNNGLEFPLIGFGTYGLGTAEIKSAIDAGYRRIDTAHGYGNEQNVGEAIKLSGIPREEFIITTKATNGALREDSIPAEFEKSLANLGTDYVDLYLIHWPVKEKYVSAWLELEKIYKTGKAKAIGFSNYQTYHLDELQKAWTITPMVNQVELHPYLTQKPLIEYCKKLGIAMEAWSPLGAGKSTLFDEPLIIDIGKKYNKTPSQIILRWDIDQGIMTIPKSSNPARMKSNLQIFDVTLTSEEIYAIDSLNKNLRTGPDPDNFTF